MKLYYHHVGKPGASRDFPKTVYQTHSVGMLNKYIPNSNPHKTDIIDKVTRAFPTGQFNCWGVPIGANTVIKNLDEGDVVFLVESTHWIDSSIPVLCDVKVFPRTILPELSDYLWGDSKFPYIFFFNTERIFLNWINFTEDLGYKSNFDPRGKFYSVADSKLAKFGGVGGYLEKIKKQANEI